MYRCHVCGTVSRPGATLLKHVVRRLDGQIAAELPVCGTCSSMLAAGIPYAQVVKQRGKAIEPSPTTALPPPEPLPPVRVGVPVALKIPPKR